ncbi:aldehyde dehydrogenase family protein [Streptomyces odontomachi]|uniref:aldehyde dehydrogenase family protein n=1 Tax=Streptomyces odontomachi TaxID=2944940 RepID=UPI002109A2AE|nr:aldehyde dehydrogenase family protein [Streptomyces sp. ODS25]
MTQTQTTLPGHAVPGLPEPRQPWPVDVVEPATGAVLASYVGGGRADAALAVDAASAALPDWSATPTPRRAAALLAIAAALRTPDVTEELAVLTARETGKRLAEARAEVGMSAGFFEWFAAAVQGRTAHQLDVVPGIRHEVNSRPLGVVAVATPWNFPLSIPARKIAAALAAGCTVLFKPSEVAAGSALRLAEIVAGQVPSGALCTLLGDGAAITETWIDDPRVRGISFTGSTRVGLLVAERARHSLTRPVLELGGNAPFVVLDDADPTDAVELINGAKYRNNGQSCIAANTAWVPRRMLDTVVEALLDTAGSLVLGDPLDPATTLGALALPSDPARVDELAEDARRRGATVHRPGPAAPGQGQFARPAIVVDPPRDARVVTEESFAPVLPVLPYDDVTEVIEATRACDLGLAGYVATRDPDRGRRIAAALDVGIAGVNTATPNSPHVPFGGLKLSGLGWEGGQAGLDAFLAPQTIAVAGR